jgi:hypothetical protein
MQRNKSGKSMVAALFLAWLVVGTASAQRAGAGMEMSQAIQGTATVMEVNQEDGTLKLKDNQGQVFVLMVPPGSTELFDKLHVGDMINATYYQEAVLSIEKPGEPAPRLTDEQIRLRGGTGGLVAKQQTARATIVSVDPAKDTVVIRDSMGDQRSLKIHDPELKSRLSELKAGDSVDITFTQALAVRVQPKK